MKPRTPGKLIQFISTVFMVAYYGASTPLNAECSNLYANVFYTAWSTPQCPSCFSKRTVTDNGCMGPGNYTNCYPPDWSVVAYVSRTGTCLNGQCVNMRTLLFTTISYDEPCET